MVQCAVKSRGVLLVDDQPEILDLWEVLLAGRSEFHIAGRALNGEEALALLPRVDAQVVVLDVHMPGATGFEVAHWMLALRPDLTVVLVSATDEPNYATLAKAVGAAGFVAKRDFSAEALLRLMP